MDSCGFTTIPKRPNSTHCCLRRNWKADRQLRAYKVTDSARAHCKLAMRAKSEALPCMALQPRAPRPTTMDELISLAFGLIKAILIWRISVCTIGTTIVAIGLSQHFEWFTGYMGITLVLTVLGFGALWHGRASAGVGLTERVPIPPISWPVVFLGLVVIGLFWGALLTAILGSTTSAVLLAAAPYIVGCLRTWLLRVRFRPGYLTMCAAALLTGFGALLFLGWQRQLRKVLGCTSHRPALGVLGGAASTLASIRA